MSSPFRYTKRPFHLSMPRGILFLVQKVLFCFHIDVFSGETLFSMDSVFGKVLFITVIHVFKSWEPCWALSI